MIADEPQRAIGGRSAHLSRAPISNGRDLRDRVTEKRGHIGKCDGIRLLLGSSRIHGAHLESREPNRPALTQRVQGDRATARYPNVEAVEARTVLLDQVEARAGHARQC
ncbi:hypothetical protein [Dactylosporangium sp. NPDC050588]|uniref:hypothetical protein n=1 Tax=Dactylosporangium sp. NPDC050588 TaxID=3157211 RepID=UPI0033FF14E8